MMLDYLQAFREWFKLKVSLWGKKNHLVFKQGDIWWCSVGMNLGEEIFGKGVRFTRPVLVYKKFTSNSFLGLPLTTQEKTGSRILDRKRLTNRIATIGDSDFKTVRERFVQFYSS